MRWSAEKLIEPSFFSESRAWEKSKGNERLPSSLISTQYKLLFGSFVIGFTVTSACLLFLLDKMMYLFLKKEVPTSFNSELIPVSPIK